MFKILTRRHRKVKRYTAPQDLIQALTVLDLNQQNDVDSFFKRSMDFLNTLMTNIENAYKNDEIKNKAPLPNYISAKFLDAFSDINMSIATYKKFKNLMSWKQQDKKYVRNVNFQHKFTYLENIFDLKYNNHQLTETPFNPQVNSSLHFSKNNHTNNKTTAIDNNYLPDAIRKSESFIHLLYFCKENAYSRTGPGRKKKIENKAKTFAKSLNDNFQISNQKISGQLREPAYDSSLEAYYIRLTFKQYQNIKALLGNIGMDERDLPLKKYYRSMHCG